MMLRELPSRLVHPQTTVRWRLTLLYGGLFLACGAALLAITYTLVSKATVLPPKPVFFGRGNCVQAPAGSLATAPAKATAINTTCRPAQLTQPPAQVQKLLRSPAGGDVVRIAANGQRMSDLHQLEIESGIALAIMAIVAAALGWLVAGRVLRPVRTITAATRQISEASLHRRLALPGPRDELRTLADTIDALLERLEGAFNSQRRFVANASHELRTPLTATRALLEMALSDPDATMQTFRDACRQALKEGEQQERLIDALLALAHGQRGTDQREPIDLAALTREVLDAHESEVAAAGLRLDAALEPASISGDRRLIERLVSNLVENAIRHNTISGSLKTLVEPHGDHARLQITNTGPPVPTGEVQRLLQPFQRLSAERVGHRDGLGLGLSIVAAIAAAHAAALEIKPGVSGGLRIEVRFPLGGHSGARVAANQTPAARAGAGWAAIARGL